MGKIIIDESEIIDTQAMKTLEKLASFFHRMEHPYQMPDAMANWLHEFTGSSGTDSYHAVPIGYGPTPLTLRCIFKKEMIVMEFSDPYGMRLMELQLHT